MSRDDDWDAQGELAELLAAERAVHPPADSAERVRARVATSVAVGAPAPDLMGLVEPGAGLGAAAGASSGGAGALGAAAAGASASVSVGAAGGGLVAAVLGAAGATALGAWLILAPTESPQDEVSARAAAPIAPPALQPPSAVGPSPADTTRPTTGLDPIEPGPAEPSPIEPPAIDTADKPPPAAEAAAATPPAPRPAPAGPATRRAPPRSTPAARAPRHAPARDTQSPQPVEPAPPAVDDALRQELELLAEARAALAADAPHKALAALERHARRHAKGRFGQERALLMVRALLSAGQLDAAQREADRFRVLYPRSLHRPAVDQLVPPATAGDSTTTP